MGVGGIQTREHLPSGSPFVCAPRSSTRTVLPRLSFKNPVTSFKKKGWSTELSAHPPETESDAETAYCLVEKHILPISNV